LERENNFRVQLFLKKKKKGNFVCHKDKDKNEIIPLMYETGVDSFSKI
jgi:hypothetical protein